ncbi:hypothetical protein NDU88_005267 [Pleurodeles waltl]|uniref:Uncharacterized protein n=1 Tax=Pleurodeles waltl TaxID=8319 RepID=A0AAV7WBD5_PLEWA|nr:hypothetical protein NDU88_005267 [Pleurodeles waltl]
MGRHRRTDVSQGNIVEQYTTVVPTPQSVTRLGGSDDGQSGLLLAKEPLRAEILAAIQGSRVALEGKIETVSVEVNLLKADLRKVFDKVKVAEGSIGDTGGGSSHFFEQPEEVWRWLELWDKIELGGTAETSGVAQRTSGAGGPDWRTRE